MKKNCLDFDKRFEGLLKGKVVVVTGAGSGLGKAIALGLPYAGVKIGVLDMNASSVKTVVEEINSNYPNSAFPMIASVTDETQLEKVYSELSKAKGFGTVDILVNCAGIAKLGSIDSLSPKDIKLANDVNINGYFLNTSFATKQMIPKKEGNIINISSASARSMSHNSSVYGVAKEAQCMMTRSWALDLGKHNIMVNALLCGDLFGNVELGIESAIWNQTYFERKAVDKGLVKANDSRLGGKTLNPEIRALVVKYYVERTALQKEITYKDVASMIILLCSDFCPKITGESIAITSGNPAAFSR
ncbi:MAG: SDR family NAD(P)-dependent oxidoreductase [archaeon]|jgi:NAD(P)-dependent dehydrogenase (short-subunit alcohol dehydrogenase family)